MLLTSFQAFVDPLAHHTLTVYRMNTTFFRHPIATIDLPKVNYIHSFSVTQTRAIIFAYPFYYKFIDAPFGAYVEKFLTWDKEAVTHIYEVDLATGKVVEQTTDSTFCFHHVNAWDLPPSLATASGAVPEQYVGRGDPGSTSTSSSGVGGWVVDALCYDPEHAQTIMSKWDVTHGEPPPQIGASMRRYTSTSTTSTASSRTEKGLATPASGVVTGPTLVVAPGSDRAQPVETPAAVDADAGRTAASIINPVPWELLSAAQFELPRINDNLHLNSSYCVIYGWTAVAIIRVDICKNITVEWQPTAPNQYPSEAVFVPREDIAAMAAGGHASASTAALVESDGVLVAVVFDGILKTSSVVLFNPVTLEVLANATSPIFTPFSIHGAWNAAAP